MDSLCVCFSRQSRDEPLVVSVFQDSARLCKVPTDHQQLVIDLKQSITDAISIPFEEIRLEAAGAYLYDGCTLGTFFLGQSTADVILHRESKPLICEPSIWEELQPPYFVNTKTLEDWFSSKTAVRLNVLQKENMELAFSVMIAMMNKGGLKPVLSVMRSDTINCNVWVEALTETVNQFEIFNGNFEYWGNALPSGPSHYDVIRLGAHVLTITNKQPDAEGIFIIDSQAQVAASITATSVEDLLQIDIGEGVVDPVLMIACLLFFHVFHNAGEA